MSARVWIAEPAEAADVARLLGAFRDWYGYPAPSDEDLRSVVDRLIGTEHTEYFLGSPEQDSDTAAVAQVRYRPSIWTTSDDCWLEDLYVEESARGTGLGRALTEAVIERARERGCGRVELDVDVVNERARRLYGSLGFADKTDGGSLLLKRPLRQRSDSRPTE